MSADVESEGRICSRCVSDDTIPGIRFDENGVCNFCQIHDGLDKQFPLNDVGRQKLEGIIERIEKSGQGHKYDCIVGVSGGTDSTYCLFKAKELGLRPLAVHFDNGWNSEASVSNINHSVDHLKVDLQTVKVDVDEFSDLQLSFLKASVPDAEIPTDIAIHSVLHRKAVENDVRWIINGMNFRTEDPAFGMELYGWQVRQEGAGRFGTRPLTTYNNLTMFDMVSFSLLKGIKTVPMLAYMDQSKEDIKEILRNKMEWVDYGGHHFESLYTRFVITDILWNKFGIDKRMIQLSAAVRSGKMSRDTALKVLEKPPILDEDITRSVLSKLGLSQEEFQEILALPRRTFHDYPTNYPMIKALRWPIKFACHLNLVPKIFYEKYLGARA